MEQNINLTEAVCTRISHDLIGNIGAVANAVELLEEGDMDFLSDIKSILKVSSGVLSARLKFFRMAFGLSNAGLENMETLKHVCADYLATVGSRNTPVSLAFSLKTPELGRWAMLAVMVLADALIKGGIIEVGDDGKRLVAAVDTLDLSAEKVDRMLEISQGRQPENLAFYAPLLYLRHITGEAGRNLRILNQNGLAVLVE